MNLVQLTPIEVEFNLTTATLIGAGGSKSMGKFHHLTTAVLLINDFFNLLVCMRIGIITSLLGKAVDLLCLSTASQVKCPHSDVVGNLAS